MSDDDGIDIADFFDGLRTVSLSPTADESAKKLADVYRMTAEYIRQLRSENAALVRRVGDLGRCLNMTRELYGNVVVPTWMTKESK